MKRIKLFLLAMVMALFVGGASAGGANADTVAFNVSIPGFSINCDGQLETSGGPPPASITLIGASFDGAAGSSNPCDPADFTVNNNPVITFSGSGPYTATINQIRFTDFASPNSCTYIAANTILTSTGSENGPYNGSDSGPGLGFPCFLVTATLTFTDVYLGEPGPATMHIEIPKLSIDCDAQMDTAGGPPPANTTLVGASFAGDSTGANPCNPVNITVTNNPVVSFAGSGPYVASIDSLVFNNQAMTGCTLTATNTALISWGTVREPYSGSDNAVGSGGFICNSFSDTVTISDLNFP